MVLDYITWALIGVTLILLIIVLIRQSRSDPGESKKQIDEISRKVSGFGETVNNEFERSRRENAASQAAMREETARSVNNVAARMEQMRTDNSERAAALEKMMIQSLSEIKLNDAEQNEKQTRMLSESVEKMRESNEKKLEEMRTTVDEKLTATLSTRLEASFRTVSDRLESVNKSLGEMKELSTGVTTNVTALNRVLTNVKARGTWAEVQLGAILDQTIPGMYENNFVCVPGSQDRVEFAVKIPSGDGITAYLPIDSKFPMEDYIRLCDAADAADSAALEAARKTLEARVLSEAKSISKYINVPVTTPYAIMYLATEGLYAEITAARSGIAERIQREYSVMIAGPSTVTALLNSLSLGFRAVAINEKANEVRILLGAAKQQYDIFGNLIRKARKKIDEAGKTLDDADKRNDIILKKLGKAELIDGAEAGDIPGLTGPAETEIKEED